MEKSTAVANANIALIKYWGKSNQENNIPAVSSISMTLNNLGTKTTVRISNCDSLVVNNMSVSVEAYNKYLLFLNRFRKKYNIKQCVSANSVNNIPYGAGLASSASAFAALSLALNDLFKLNLTPADLSILSRFGSGSAARSIFGGYVALPGGQNISSSESYAFPIKAKKKLDLVMLILLISDKKKSISSSKAMSITASTSPFYKDFIKTSSQDYNIALRALSDGDFKSLGDIMEQSTLKMHSTMHTSKPSINYFLGQTVELINFIYKIRAEYGPMVFFTMDAGPNVKLLIEQKNIEFIKKNIKRNYPNLKILVSKPGTGAHLSLEHLI